MHIVAKAFALALASLASPDIAAAATSCVVIYRHSCETIVTTSYSTGGDQSFVQYAEVDCRDADNAYSKYIIQRFAASGIFGVARSFMPDKIQFVRSDTEKTNFVCK